MFTFWHIETLLKTSSVATGCGVVTTTAPVDLHPLRERERDVAGAGREIEDEEVELAPVHVVQELLQRAVQHRAAPDDGGLRVLEEEADSTSASRRSARAGRSSCRRC